MELQGLSIIVSGASGNLGAAVCKRLLADGARVAALVTRAESGEKLEAALGAGERVVPLVADLGDARAAEAAFAAAEKALGPLFAAVHTVGGWAGGKRVAEAEVADLDAMLAVNLRTAFIFAGAAMRRFAERRAGRIVTVAALTVATGTRLAGNAPYAASKAGLIALSKVLAVELAPAIRVNVVCPGAVDTPMLRTTFPDDDAIARISARYALQRMATADEVANAVLFLLSDESSFITGATLTVDGGRTFY